MKRADEFWLGMILGALVCGVSILAAGLDWGANAAPIFFREDRVIARTYYVAANGYPPAWAIHVQHGGIGNYMTIKTDSKYDGYELGDTYPKVR